MAQCIEIVPSDPPSECFHRAVCTQKVPLVSLAWFLGPYLRSKIKGLKFYCPIVLRQGCVFLCTVQCISLVVTRIPMVQYFFMSMSTCIQKTVLEYVHEYEFENYNSN